MVIQHNATFDENDFGHLHSEVQKEFVDFNAEEEPTPVPEQQQPEETPEPTQPMVREYPERPEQQQPEETPEPTQPIVRVHPERSRRPPVRFGVDEYVSMASGATTQWNQTPWKGHLQYVD